MMRIRVRVIVIEDVLAIKEFKMPCCITEWNLVQYDTRLATHVTFPCVRAIFIRLAICLGDVMGEVAYPVVIPTPILAGNRFVSVLLNIITALIECIR